MRPRLQRHLHGVPATETAYVSRPAGRAASRTQPRLQRLRPWLIAGALSLGWHVVAVLPGIAKLGEPPERELELTYLGAPDETPTPPEQADKTEPKPEELAQKPEEKQPPAPEKKPKKEEEPPELAERIKKPPEPKPPEKPEPPPLELQQIPHLKMVEQKQFPDEDDNDKARFLAEKNHRAAEDTQDNRRNLVENMAGQEAASAPADKGKTPGDNERKVAELQDRPGDPNHLPLAAPPPTESLKPPSLAVSPLAMRSPQQQTPKLTMTEARQLDAAGTEVAQAQLSPESQRSQGKFDKPQGEAGQPGISPSRVNTHDYDRIIGYDVAENERRVAALAQQSKVQGRWERIMEQQAMMRSSLENFTPNVRVGNQSELGTRAHPFAGYIAAVHRQIHKFWGDGFLADLDRTPRGGGYDRSLVTAVEISLKDDGTVNQLIIARPSGSLPFDIAALDAVRRAAPFASPPKVIRSKDGNVYITWFFHRDERQCATDFVNAHILTTPKKPEAPKSSAPQPTPLLSPLAETQNRMGIGGGAGGGAGGSMFSRQTGGGGSGVGGVGGVGGSGVGRVGAVGGSGVGGVGGGGSGPFGGLSGLGGGGPVASASAAKEAAKEAAREAKEARDAAKEAKEVSDDARAVGERWLSGFQKADVKWLTGSSAVPFTAGGKTVAEDGPALRAFYQDMLDEGTPKHQKVLYLNPAQIKKRLGHLPRGGDDDEMVFAVVEQAGDDLVLILQSTERGWRVVGIDR